MHGHDAHEVGIEARQCAGRLLGQGDIVGIAPRHIGDAAAVALEPLDDDAGLVEVPCARHAVGSFKLEPIRQAAVREETPQGRRRALPHRMTHKGAQAAARQSQGSAIIGAQGKRAVLLAPEEAASDGLAGVPALVAGRPGVRGGKGEKGIVGYREQLGGQHRVERLGVVAVHGHAQQHGHQLGLRALAEARPAGHDALETRLAQRLLIEGGAGHAAQQQSHLPRARPRVPQLGEAVGHLASAAPRCLVG